MPPTTDITPEASRAARLAEAAACLDLPTPRDPRQELADPTPSLDRCRRAIDLYDTLLQASPEDPQVLAERAYAYFLMGNGMHAQERHTAAVAFYAKVAEHPPGRDLPWYRRWVQGYCFELWSLRFNEELLAFVQDELAAQADDQGLLRYAAMAQQGLRRPAEAVATYQRLLALTTGTQRASVLSNLAGAYHGWDGHAAEALAAIDAALALDPDNARYHHNRELALAAATRGAPATGLALEPSSGTA